MCDGNGLFFQCWRVNPPHTLHKRQLVMQHPTDIKSAILLRYSVCSSRLIISLNTIQNRVSDGNKSRNIDLWLWPNLITNMGRGSKNIAPTFLCFVFWPFSPVNKWGIIMSFCLLKWWLVQSPLSLFFLFLSTIARQIETKRLKHKVRCN